MTELDKNDLSKIINSYIGGRPFQSLSNILKNSGFYDQNKKNTADIINSFDDSEYKSLKRHFTNLRKSVISDIHLLEEQNSSNNEVDSFLRFISLIFDVSTIIQKRDEQTIDNLKEANDTKKSSTSSQQKSKGESDSHSKSTNDQAETISKLKKKLSKANEQITFLKTQIKSAKEEGKSEVIQDLTDHYHLSQNSGNDIHSLISNLDNCIEANNSTAQSESGESLSDDASVVKKIVKSFDLPPDTTPKNIVSELQQKLVEMVKINAEMNNQKDDRENCPIGPTDDPSDPSILRSQLVATVNSLRSELDHLKCDVAEQDEVLQVFCNIPLKPDQADSIVQEAENNEKSFIQKVRDIVSILAIQIFQSEDTEVLNTRLLSLVAGLFQFINAIGTSKAAYTSLYPECPFDEMRPVILSQAERVHLFLCENGHAFTQDQKSLFEELITNNNYYPLKGIDANSISSMNLLTHVKNYLNEYTRKPSSVEGQVLYVIALEAVCACDILQRYSDTVKNACTRQIQEAKQLKNYSVQLEKSIEDQQVYIQGMSMMQNEEKNNTQEENDEYFDNDKDSFNNSLNNNRSREDSRNYDNNQSYENTNNSRENTNESNNNRRRRDHNRSNENSRNKDSNSKNSDDKNNDGAVKNRDVKNNDKADKDLNKVRSILRKGLTDHDHERKNNEGNEENNCNCIESILEALDHLNQEEVEIVPDDRYIQSLQTQLRDAKAENKEWKKKNDDLIKDTHNDIANVQAQVSKMNETMNKRIELKKAQNQKLVKALKDAKQNMDKLVKKNKELQQKLSSAGSQEGEESSRQIADEIQKNFDETKKDYENILSQMKASIENKQKEIDSLKESQDSLQQQLEEEKQKNATLSKQVKQAEKSVKEKIEKYKKKEAKAIDQASLLSEKYQEIHRDLEILENEKKIMQDKYQNIENEKALIQSSLKNYSETLEEFEKLRKSHDQLLNEKKTENQQFLSKVAALFPTYADLSVTISKESILDILENVREDLETIPQYQTKVGTKDDIIQKVKESLNIESDDSIVEKLNALIKSNNEMDQSNRLMYSELKASQDSRINLLELQDWLIRMYVLVTGGVCQDVTTREMQHAIEDNITSKYENLILSRKNALLKAEKKLLKSKTFTKINSEFENEIENEKENEQPKNYEEEEEEDANQSSTEIEIDNLPKQNKTKNNKNVSLNKKKKKKDKRNYSFRHLLIMAMLICKAKRLSGNGEGGSYGLDIGDTNNNNKDGRQYSTSFSPISKPTSNNYVFGLD